MRLEQEYKKVRRALEFMMPVIMEKVDDKDFKRRVFEKRKEQLMSDHEERELFLNESEFKLIV